LVPLALRFDQFIDRLVNGLIDWSVSVDQYDINWGIIADCRY